MTTLTTKDFSKDLQKIITANTEYQKNLAKLSNPEAKRFFLTYYSG